MKEQMKETTTETKQRQLVREVADRILAVANLYNEVTTSDLQGTADAEAKSLITDLKRYWRVT